MTTTTKRFTFEEYLNYDDGTDNRYELVDEWYEPAEFRETEQIKSQIFSELNITVEQILRQNI